jgi:hypothetical protein
VRCSKETGPWRTLEIAHRAIRMDLGAGLNLCSLTQDNKLLFCEAGLKTLLDLSRSRFDRRNTQAPYEMTLS